MMPTLSDLRLSRLKTLSHRRTLKAQGLQRYSGDTVFGPMWNMISMSSVNSAGPLFHLPASQILCSNVPRQPFERPLLMPDPASYGLASISLGVTFETHPVVLSPPIF